MRKRQVLVSSHITETLIDNNIFPHLMRQAQVIHNVGGVVAEYAGITFLAGTDLAAVRECVHFDYAIMDFGQVDCVDEYTLRQLDRLFLVGDFGLWNYAGSVDAVRFLDRRCEADVCVLAAFTSAAGLAAYRKAFDKKPVIIPMDMEPFAISRDTLLLMEKLFKEEINKKYIRR